MAYQKKASDKKWYEEISFGIRAVVRIGGSYGFIIPKHFFDREKLEYGDEILLVGLKRKRTIADELTKAEHVEFERWKKYKETEKRLMEETLEKMEHNKL